jgi:hypothetical protein
MDCDTDDRATVALSFLLSPIAARIENISQEITRMTDVSAQLPVLVKVGAMISLSTRYQSCNVFLSLRIFAGQEFNREMMFLGSCIKFLSACVVRSGEGGLLDYYTMISIYLTHSLTHWICIS